MDCVNHSGVPASAFCQNCGKALCPNCVRTGAGGQVLCEQCLLAWQQVPSPFVPPPSLGPNPSVAAVLGFIPGVGAMYNGQFFKGFIHVVIFAVLISITDHYGIFGLFIAAWVLYQSFEAYHTAKAIREGQPLPDPLGLNEVGNWLNLGTRPHSGNPGAGAPPYPPTGAPGQPTGAYPPPPPYPGAYPPPPGVIDPSMPPMPPPVVHKAPVGAVVLIALGILFLLGQLNIFEGRLFQFFWPLLLIGLGVWLMMRRMGETKGGPQ